MANPRAVRIPRSRTQPPPAGVWRGPDDHEAPEVQTRERRTNVGGSQRAIRLTLLYVAALAVLYASFVLYDRTAPGGSSSAAGNGVLLFTFLFVAFAVGGAIYTLTPSPRGVEVAPDRTTIVGRWGFRRTLPRLELLSVSVVRRYPTGWLASTPVELIVLWGEDVPGRSYLVDAQLFEGAAAPPLRR